MSFPLLKTSDDPLVPAVHLPGSYSFDGFVETGVEIACRSYSLVGQWTQCGVGVSMFSGKQGS